jgi:alkanesulfonate monooxygenase SsuD/methylene tetrahydromethanopterin reductase-like flavin-dependent oxidoreductase (luciferase family)
MHVGFSIGPQNPGSRLRDSEVVARELRLADLAVELGFESLWVVEHHFSEYLLSPDPLQLLTWLGARHAHVRLGTGVIVLPWHHPVRCAEQIALLDNLSGGRSSGWGAASRAWSTRATASRWTARASASPRMRD